MGPRAAPRRSECECECECEMAPRAEPSWRIVLSVVARLTGVTCFHAYKKLRTVLVCSNECCPLRSRLRRTCPESG